MATHEITDYRPDKWDEKIFDAINYLLLLRGIVEEAMVRKDR
jgi:hypothetical protein